MARLVEIRQCVDVADEQLSLDVHNAVWAHRALTLAEVDSFKSSVRDYDDFLARLDGEVAGSAVAAIQPQRGDVGLTLVTVLADKRRQGAGTALYGAVSEWAGARGLDVLQTRVAEDDAVSLAYAERRGFVAIERNPRMVLDLRSIEEPQVAPPRGIEIVTWAERPELARGIYEVAVEAYADVPGAEDEDMEPFEDWLEHDMGGSGDRPAATFVAVAAGRGRGLREVQSD
jgi:GNAT superfamily N-acetyltransferase